MICFYHNDLDGRCAAAIAFKAFPGARAVELSYSAPITLDGIEPGEKVFILDFTVSPDEMEKIFERTSDVTRIDHHLTAVETVYKRAPRSIMALDKAACELAWHYFFPGVPVPEAVRLTADKDMWRWKYGEDTDAFNEGMRIFDDSPGAQVWARLLAEDAGLMSEIKAAGRVCVRYKRAFCEEYCRKFAFETTFEGLRCIAVGLQFFGSEAFGERAKHYDACLTFEFTGREWAVSIFSQTADVRRIAERYGGGGHTSAAGFTTTTPPPFLNPGAKPGASGEHAGNEQL